MADHEQDDHRRAQVVDEGDWQQPVEAEQGVRRELRVKEQGFADDHRRQHPDT